MSEEQGNWTEVRKRLRRFMARSGWSVPEIGRVLREGYAASVANDWVGRLISVEAVNPARQYGMGALLALMKTYQGKVPTFESWLGQHYASRASASSWDKQAAITAMVVAHEERREAERRQWLAREGSRPEPKSDMLDGLDAATIAALSGGTIVARGVRA